MSRTRKTWAKFIARVGVNQCGLTPERAYPWAHRIARKSLRCGRKIARELG
jgi:hypothetical protein